MTLLQHGAHVDTVNSTRYYDPLCENVTSSTGCVVNFVRVSQVDDPEHLAFVYNMSTGQSGASCYVNFLKPTLRTGS